MHIASSVKGLKHRAPSALPETLEFTQAISNRTGFTRLVVKLRI